MQIKHSIFQVWKPEADWNLIELKTQWFWLNLIPYLQISMHCTDLDGIVCIFYWGARIVKV